MTKKSIFISHSWTYSEHYEKLSEWTSQHKDNSVPKDDPIHDTDSVKELKNAIFVKIKNSDIVIVPTSIAVEYSRWIQREINGAKNYGKPILGVIPWGQERQSSTVTAAADKVVGWNKDSILKAIEELTTDIF